MAALTETITKKGYGISLAESLISSVRREAAARQSWIDAGVLGWDNDRIMRIMQHGYRDYEGKPVVHIQGPSAAIARMEWLEETEGLRDQGVF